MNFEHIGKMDNISSHLPLVKYWSFNRVSHIKSIIGRIWVNNVTKMIAWHCQVAGNKWDMFDPFIF